MMLTRGFSIGLFATTMLACTGSLSGEAAPDPSGNAGTSAGSGSGGAGGAGATAGSTSGTAGVASVGGTGGSAGGVAGSGGEGGKPEPAFPFEPTTTRNYVAKVKNILTGLAPTDEEVAAVEKDPAELATLIDKVWFLTPQAQLKMRGFYANTFQQSQVLESDMGAQVGFPTSTDFLRTRVMQTVRESFPRTVQKIVADGRPFTEAITTHTIEMNPALMAYYIMADDVLLSDDNKRTRRHPTPDGQLRMWLEFLPPEEGGPITLAQALDKKHPKYLHFPMAAPYKCQIPKVDATKHVVYGEDGKPTYTDVTFNALSYNVDNVEQGVEMKLLQRLMTGSVQGVTGGQKEVLPANLVPPVDVPASKAGDYNVKCPFRWEGGSPLLTEDDFIWRSVTIREPKAAEEGHVAFWDLPTLRTKSELVLRTPRVGFFSTPAFLGTFLTNQSNQARVTANQALIVALGRSINPVDKGAATVLDTGKDGSHSDPSSPCYSCHQTIDPLRNVFLRAWTYSYSQQFDAKHLFLDSTFDLDGVDQKMTTLDDLALVLSTHPSYAAAVTQKLCYYANSAPCSTSDPEFLRIAASFATSQFKFRDLVRELFSSPLVTGATETQTLTDRGQVVSIARYNHLCASLTNRLELTDNICSGVVPATSSSAVKASAKTLAQQLLANIPSDGFARGAEGPLLPTSSTMFFRSATESLCQLAADLQVDVAGARYQSDSATKKDQAITDFVASIMGLTVNDPARPEATKILQAHYDKAIAIKASPTDALKSTFTLACTSPTSVTLGL